MPAVAQRVLGLQESAIRKLDLLVEQQEGVDFYRLNIGQPDVPTPPAVLEALDAYRPTVLAYGAASGTAACREAAAAYESQWCPNLRPAHVAVTSGGSEALLFAFTTVCDPGDEILVPEPYYTNYNGFATVAGARVLPIRTHIEDGFSIPDDASLDRLVTPRTRAIVLNSPGNPTGVVLSHTELARVVAWACRHGLFVISDEVYRQIWFDAPPASALSLPDAADNVICIDSMSKTWSACGLRVGFLISQNATVMEKVERLGQARLGPQPLGQAGAIAALGLSDAYYAQIRDIWRSRVETLHRSLSAIGIAELPRPQGAFYLMARLPVDDADRFARFLVTEFRDRGESVVVAPGPGFYAVPTNGRNEIRLAAVLDERKLERAVELLDLALQVYPGRRPLRDGEEPL